MGLSPTPASLRRRYGVLGFALVAVGLLLGGVAFYLHKAKEVRREQFQILGAIGKLKFGQLENWRKERMADAWRVAGGPLVRQRTGEFLQAPDNPKFRNDLLEQLQLNRMGDVYSCTLLVGLDGRVLLSTDGSRDDVAPATRDLIRQVTKSPEPGLSVFFVHADGITHVDAAAAIGDATGRPLAVVVMRSNAEDLLFPLIQSWPLPSQSGETALAFRSGDEVLVPHRLRFQGKTDPLFRHPVTRTDFPAVQAILGKLGEIEGRDYRGEEVLAEARSVPGSPWVLINKIDKKEALADLHHEAVFIVGLTGALILLAGALIAFYYRQRQAESFKKLYESERQKLAAEHSLHFREAELELALSASHQGLYDFNIETGEGTFSPECATMLGYDPATFHETLQSWYERMHPEDRERVERAVNDYLTGLTDVYRVEFRQRTQTGDWKWILSLGKIIERTADGKPLRLLGTRTDINELKVAEAALRESESRYRTMVEWSPDAAAVYRDGVLLYVNPACIQLFGALSSDDLVGKPFLGLIHPDFRELALARVKETSDHGLGAPILEECFLKLDGTPINVEVQGTPILFDGRPAVFTVARDITARKQAEAALRESQDRFRDLFALAAEGIILFTLDGELLEVNEAMARMHGYKREELQGLSLKDLDTPATAQLAPERMARLLTGESLAFDVEHFHKAGHTFPLEVSANLIAVNGQPTVLAFNRDISERRAAEAKVRESEEKFRSLTEASSDYIMRYDRQGRHTYMNPAGIQASGLTAAELIGKTHRESGFPEHLCEQWEAKIQQVFATAAPAQLEFEWASSTGPVTLDLRFTPEFDAAGQVFSVLGVSRDITERKQAEQALALLQAQLQQTQKMESLGSLAGGVAHDMNNVLGAILGLATAHLEIQPPGGPAFRAFDTISKAALRGGKLVKGLLTFARQSPAEDRELDMNTLLREEVRLLERTTLSKVHLELDLAPGLRPIRGDASALTHAFMNLCVNAVDAMSASGTLTLRTRNVDNDWIEVVVEDTGSGMPQEVLDKALEPFFTTKAVGKGTGLGLSMVYSTVKAHRGQLQLQSEPGRGTCVTLRFPAWTPSASEVEPEAVPVAAAVLAPSARSLRVLVVDDDELVQSSTVALLTLLGHSATAVFSGEAALVELDAGLAADLVILDMNMPGLGGAGTLPRLRARRPTLPVLLSTGRADQTALDLVQAHPHVTLLPKPFSMKDLQAYLDALPPSAPPEPSPAP